uniref:Uncharacterized protein n=1 Tax=Anguilla anguilla TaxID=7936 RepID=A0A0E9XXU9_ANGAN
MNDRMNELILSSKQQYVCVEYNVPSLHPESVWIYAIYR